MVPIKMLEDMDKETIEAIIESPEPTLDRDETTIVYLDQKIWGQLHDGRHNSDSDYTEAYQAIRDAVDTEEVICPYSFARFIETDVHRDGEFKREIYELMIDLSNNFCMRNYFDAIGAEITAYLFKHIDILPEIHPAERIFSRGIVEPYGRPRITTDGEPIDDEWKFHKFHRSEEGTRAVIRDIDFSEDVPDPRDEEERREYVENIEAIRQRYDEIDGSEEERREQLIIESFRNDVVPGLSTTAMQFPMDLDLRYILAFDTAFRGFNDFFMQFPTYYAHLDLTLGRDFHRERDIEANDLFDIMPLAVAIPYTDIVVTEDFFSGVAHRQDLPNRFGTTILTDAQDLAEHLTNL